MTDLERLNLFLAHIHVLIWVSCLIARCLTSLVGGKQIPFWGTKSIPLSVLFECSCALAGISTVLAYRS